MSGGQQALVGLGSETLTGATIYNTQVNMPGMVAGHGYITFMPDGRVLMTKSGWGTDQLYNYWMQPPVAAVGQNYWIYFGRIPGTGAGGGAPDPGNLSTENAWIQLNVNRAIGYWNLTPYRMASWDCHIARSSGGPILVTHRLDSYIWIA